jgi:DNA polymerase III epsilon subunit-like protein
MRGDTEWILLDTETTGLVKPIWALEIAAVRFRGWKRVGEPFQVFLNHQVQPAPEAVELHGYDLKFQAKHGIDPVAAHRKFQSYVAGAPVCAHNLKYDYGKVLRPELDHFGLPGLRYGFCTMWLAQRALPHLTSYGQGTIADAYGIANPTAHQALSDVTSLAEIVEKVLAPCIQGTDFDDFESIQELTEIVPEEMGAAAIKRAQLRSRKGQAGSGKE